MHWIIQAGGAPVIAHPSRYKLTRTKFRELLAEFKELGGLRMEVAYANSTKDDIANMAKQANDFNL